jgi:selenocysteine-specific elongation factor
VRRVGRPGASALAQLRLEQPTVAARGDRFVVRSYSPQRTIGGGVVIDPLAQRRRRRGGEVGELVVRESGSIPARLLQTLSGEPGWLATGRLVQLLSEPEPVVREALEHLRAREQLVQPVADRWLAARRWAEVLAAIQREVATHAEKYPTRYGIPKGDLKSALKASMDSALFDAAFEALRATSEIEMKGERVRPAGKPWEPPSDSAAALDRVEKQLEAAGFSVPETAAWLGQLAHAHGGGPRGAAFAAEVASLGQFLGRLVRVSQEYCYTARQMEELRRRLTAHFERSPTLPVTAFKDLVGVSRKWAVPLLEHCDRIGWTVRAGDERKRGRL